MKRRKKALSAYRHGKKTSHGGMSQHALTMAIFKEIRKNLEACNIVFVNRKDLGMSEFFTKKGVTLAKVCKCAMYMIDTADRSAAADTVQIYDNIYNYILQKALHANQHTDHESVKQALFMSKELIAIWDSIPEHARS